MVLLIGARTSEDVAFRDELLGLAALMNGFTLVFAFSRGSPSRPGDYGHRIDEAVISEVSALLPGRPTRVFACGANALSMGGRRPGGGGRSPSLDPNRTYGG